MLAPAVLFAYNRPLHTRATLEALARNALAGQTALIVFSDGAKGEKDLPQVQAVRGVIAAAAGFDSVRVIERERNWGLARSVIDGVSRMLAEHGRVIVLEDDLVTSPGFLSYMNAALEHYAADPKAFSIGGYQFPEKTMPIPPAYAWDTYASYRCCSWGWATWQDRWQRIDWEMGYFDAFMASPQQQARFNRGGPDMTQLLSLQRSGRIDSWAIRFCYAHFAFDMRCIYPVKSLVNNIGLDNSGVHCRTDPRRQHDSLDEAWQPRAFCAADPVDPVLEARFFQAFAPEKVAEVPPSGARLFARKARSALRLLIHGLRHLAGRVRQLLFPPVRDVDVLVVNTFQKSGGAARAAYRAFLGIHDARPKSRYLTLTKEDLAPDIDGRYQWSIKGLLATRFASWDRIPMLRYPGRKPVTFTPAAWINPLRVPLSRYRARIVHLHWVASSLLRIEDLGRVHAPVVWTLHDTWAFTGGCHYTGDCDRFRQECGKCPQLGSDQAGDLSHDIWQRKRQAYQRMNLTVVAPSHWLAGLARQSSLLAGVRVEVIPNGLDTDVFKPVDPSAARAYFSLDAHRPTLLFVAQWLTDPRKGGDLLSAALDLIDFPCTVLTVGNGALRPPANPQVAIRAFGSLRDDISMALLYSAADVFLCPSREDNLPNTVAEAMACGTPCVAFDVNGLPEMIRHRANGWLARAFDAADFATGISWVARHPEATVLRQAARDHALASYSAAVATARYLALFDELAALPRP